MIAVALAGLPLAHADEGQWQPHQLLQLKPELQRVGIAIAPEKLADLSQHPMSAMVSLGGCSASFVSASGLVVTNHHCAYGAIQRNSTVVNNFINRGFLANTRAEELPAGSDARMYVTETLENVTAKVLQGITPTMSGKLRHAHVENHIKALIAECEQNKEYRCSVPEFHRGLEYYLIRQLMIRDVRLVYAPAESVGDFGGDVDNFEWPRQAGDFAFLRAYVGKDGRPANPSPDNVPYRPKSFLTISAQGLKAGDPILLAGYPGRTSRYKLPAEIRFARDHSYPERVEEARADLAVIAAATQGNAKNVVRYASVVKGMHNGLKKREGLLAGFARKDIAAIKDEQYAAFRAWYAQQHADPALLKELEDVIASDMALSDEEFAWSVANTSALLKSARTLYRVALESEKPDTEREPGFQQRDLALVAARLNRLERSYDQNVDQARYTAALQRYNKLPASMHPQGLDVLLPAPETVVALYQQSQLGNTATRLAWMSKDVSAFKNSDDAFIRLAVKLHETDIALENRRKEIEGNLERLIPQTMQAMIDWKKSQGKPVYPDANGT
ncbi:MAG: S46 family peptidase, partial [Burkholderiales bacterium]|nr:S46 family peptidase [Burkholderiales bacterium]